MKKTLTMIDTRSAAYGKITPLLWLENMYKESAGDELLIVPERPYLMPADAIGKRFMLCKMVWNAKDVKRLETEYKHIIECFQKLAEKEAAEDETIIPPAAAHIWERYVRGFNEKLFDEDVEKSVRNMVFFESDAELKKIQEKIEQRQARSSGGKRNYGRSVQGENMFSYWRFVGSVCLEAEVRIGKSDFAFDEILRAKRVYCLINDHAPKRLVDREEKLLIQNMSLHRYCQSYEIVDLVTAVGLPLDEAQNIGVLQGILYPRKKMEVYQNMSELLNQDGGKPYVKDPLGKIAQWVTNNKELNPEGKCFMGISEKEGGHYILLQSDGAEVKSKKEEKEQIILVKRLARLWGISENQVQEYTIMQINA